METTAPQTPASSTPLPARADAWLAFAVLLQGLVMAALSISTIAGLRPQLESALNIQEQKVLFDYDLIKMVPPGQIDLSSSLYGLTFILIMPVWIWVVHLVGYHRACILATLLFSAGSLGVALTGSIVFHFYLNLNWLVGWRMVQAAGGGAFLPLAGALTKYLYHSAEPDVNPEYFPDGRSNLTGLVLYFVTFLGALLGSLYATKLLEISADWFIVPLLNAFFGLGAIVLLSTLQEVAQPSEVQINWLAWALLVIIFFFLSMALTIHTPQSIPREPELGADALLQLWL